MQNRKLISISIAILGIILMGLWTVFALRLFVPSIYKHIQLPINLIFLMGLLSCIPCIICTLGMVLRTPWSSPLSAFFFLYNALTLVLYLRLLIQVGAYSDYFELSLWLSSIAVFICLGCSFVLDVKVKEFLKFSNIKSFVQYLTQNKISLISLTIIILIAEIIIVKQYLYYQQYPWPPPEISNAEIHKMWPFFVKGDISNQEIEEIISVVKNTKDVDGRILSMRRNGDGTVSVNTGRINGPLNGYGYTLTFKKNKSWTIILKRGWVS